MGSQRVGHNWATFTHSLTQVKSTLLCEPYLDSDSKKQTTKTINRTIVCVLSCFSYVLLSMTLWTIAHQAPLSRGFSRKEYWGGSPAPLHRIFLTQGLTPRFLLSPTLAGGFFTTSANWEVPNSSIRGMWILAGYLIIMWNYSLAGWGKVAVIDIVIMFNKGSPCFF